MNVGRAILIFAIAVPGTAILGLVSKWVDRKVTARVQWRVGPPWYQPFADFIKLLLKETIVPKAARRTGFLLAPVVGFAAMSVAAAILWHANVVGTGAFVGDLIVVLYLLTIPSLMIIVAGSASGNPHAAVGAAREMKLILSYELPFVLAIIAVLVGMGDKITVDLGEVARADLVGLGPQAACVLGLIISIFCVQAKLGLVPFDIAEAETEIMSGPYVEYSGSPLALFYLTRAMMFAILPIFLVTIFWGGLSLEGLGPLWFVLKYLAVVVIIVLMRNTNPRIRIDHAVKFFWFFMTPLALIAVGLAMIPRLL